MSTLTKTTITTVLLTTTLLLTSCANTNSQPSPQPVPTQEATQEATPTPAQTQQQTTPPTNTQEDQTITSALKNADPNIQTVQVEYPPQHPLRINITITQTTPTEATPEYIETLGKALMKVGLKGVREIGLQINGIDLKPAAADTIYSWEPLGEQGILILG